MTRIIFDSTNSADTPLWRDYHQRLNTPEDERPRPVVEEPVITQRVQPVHGDDDKQKGR